MRKIFRNAQYLQSSTNHLKHIDDRYFESHSTEKASGDNMVKSLKRLAKFLFTNTPIGLGTGMIEHHFDGDLRVIVNQKVPGDYYTYWFIGYSLFAGLNTLLTKGDKWNKSRIVDIIANTIYGITMNDIGWLVGQEKSVNIIGKPNHETWLGDYFGPIGDTLSIKILGLPAGYFVAGGIYIIYLSYYLHKVYKCHKTIKKADQEDLMERINYKIK